MLTTLIHYITNKEEISELESKKKKKKSRDKNTHTNYLFYWSSFKLYHYLVYKIIKPITNKQINSVNKSRMNQLKGINNWIEKWVDSVRDGLIDSQPTKHVFKKTKTKNNNNGKASTYF